MKRILIAVLLVAAGCSLQTTGAKKGNLRLHAVFSDVQSLVPGENVDISDVQVGSVTAIKLDGYQATVTMAIDSSHQVPEGTTAVLSQTSLLGEQYISLEVPAHFDPRTGPWVASGATLPSTATEGIEALTSRAGQVLGAVDAGDLASTLQALSTGLAGKGPELHQIIAQLATVAAAVNAQSGAVASTIDNLGRLGATLAPQSAAIGQLIDTLTSSTSVLAANREKLINTLTELTRLSTDLNGEVLQPHLAQIETLVGQLGPVLAAAVQSRSNLEDLITGLDHFVNVLPSASYQGSLLIFLFFAGLVNDGGQRLPFPTAGPATSLTSLLSPTPRPTPPKPTP